MTPDALTTTDDADPTGWRVKRFDELSVAELYDILTLRQRVFIIEQSSIFRELDDVDRDCVHVFRREPDGRLSAYLRIAPPGVCFTEGCIGRIVTAPEQRGTGLGVELMRRGLDVYALACGPGPIRIAAQARLGGFYEKFGFSLAGEPYDDGGIEHVEMLRPGGAG